MKILSGNTVLLLILSYLFLVSYAQRQPYIVYLGEHSGQKTVQEIEEEHHSYVLFAKNSLEEAKSSIIYSYTNVINGFAAFLTPREATAISELEGVISVFKDQGYELHTSRSWEFVSLLESNWNPSNSDGLQGLLGKANSGANVIVGILDTGIWPESESFVDTEMGPIPSSWRGTCQAGAQFTATKCNKKLIGARFFVSGFEAFYGIVTPALDYRSPRDIDGHGTHVASTIGGASVHNASSMGGFGSGTIRGGAPLAHLAIYKVCWRIPGGGGNSTCMSSDILAAFDSAINDGVHVISASIGSNTSSPFNQDTRAIGSLHAAKRDIVVSFSAGNSGPTPGSVTNVAPWTLSVGASSIDRVFFSPAWLWNGYQARGESITPFGETHFPLVYAGDIEIPNSTTAETSGRCLPGTLSPVLAKGTAVFCLWGNPSQADEVKRAGGVAAVLRNVYDGIGVSVRRYSLPTTVVLANETNAIYTYIRVAPVAVVNLRPADTLIGTKPAPYMAPFTSRGPSTAEPNILKPDITAPGFNILAAYTQSRSADDKFTFLSGTSTACSHVSGIVTLLKAIHPTWSNAAIRSAIMTTASVVNNEFGTITDAMLQPATPFAYGSGHIRPSVAADPGLVYDATYNDYIEFLCASVGQTLDPDYTCPTSEVPSPSNLNYPSLSIANVQGITSVRRNVTNVGNATARYSVSIEQPAGYSVRILPSTLSFDQTGQTLSFSVIVRARATAVRDQYAFGSYTWTDGVHQVRSPIALSTTRSVTTNSDVGVHEVSPTTLSRKNIATTYPDVGLHASI